MTKLLDLSYWQKTVDFTKIKNAGYDYVILRAGYGTTKDKNFDIYATACKKAGIKIGAYFFSYATSVVEAKEEASFCLSIIKPYTIDLPIFFDLEGDSVKKAKEKGVTIGKAECSAFTVAFCEAIKAAGYTPGYYANTNYFNSMYDANTKNKGYVFWLAHYKTDRSYHNPPIQCDFFQYSDQGKVDGITTSVDLDVCLNTKFLNCRKKEERKKMAYTKQDAINAVLNTALAENGYLEKRTNANLDSKTSNAGSANYTKYWRDVKPDYQGQPWCAAFVSWVLMIVFGLENAKKLLKHWPFVYCPAIAGLFTLNANPKVGDVVIFKRNGVFAHTGLVTKVQGDKFWTIEGNTSGASGIIDNGGGVCQKSYYNSNLPGTKFITIDWDKAAEMLNDSNKKVNITTTTTSVTTATTTKSYLSKGDKGAAVKDMQEKLIACGYNCGSAGADGDFGSGTEKALKAFQKANKLEVDGKYGQASKKTLESKVAYKAWVAKCTALQLYVRKGPGTSYDPIEEYPVIGLGNKVDVIGEKKATDGIVWYQIRIAGKYTGYSSSKYLIKS